MMNWDNILLIAFGVLALAWPISLLVEVLQ